MKKLYWAIPLIVLAVAALIFVAVVAGEPDCEPFVQWQRYEGTLSPVPEFVRDGLPYEVVTLFVCADGSVRAKREHRGGADR